MNKLEKIIYKYALINAVRHKGKALEGAVMGAVMSSEPQLRTRAQEISQLVSRVVEKVNSMDRDEQEAEIQRLEIIIEEKRGEKRMGLPPLPDAEESVVLRFAPNPSGPLHIGHARAAILNDEYAKKYDGKLILRLEDTDPRRVDPEAYDMIQEDLEWMGIEWDKSVIQSDRIPIYYEYTVKLLKEGNGYVCTCRPSKFKKLKDASKPCPCRDLRPRENLERWEKMFEMGEGDAVVRVKTDLGHKNPAIRDWGAMRIVEESHPRIGSKYRIYPMMNFAVAIDDHLLGITHVLRGKDHITNSEKQEYLYRHFRWETPTFIHYGRLRMDDVRLSTSKAREAIDKGLYWGWDDPRLGTIRAIIRRGIKPEAIRKTMIEIGVKIADSTLSWEKIYGLNRNILDEVANRYFFVAEPVRFDIKDLPKSLEAIVKRPLHPDHPERGYRKIPFTGSVYISRDDLKDDTLLRLVDAVNVKLEDDTLRYYSESLDNARSLNARIIHWVPVDESIHGEVVMPDATILKGFLEPDASNLKVDEIVQLERFGFARVDKVDEKIRFYYTHK